MRTNRPNLSPLDPIYNPEKRRGQILVGNTPAAVSAPALNVAILALAPAGYWKLDEASGSTANDSSGNGRNGTYGGPTLQGQAAPDGASYATFDGSNDDVSIADNNAWSVNNSGTGMTLFLLMRPVVFSANTFLIGKETSSTDTEWNLQGGLGAATRRSGLSTIAVSSLSTGLAASTWHAVAVRWVDANTAPRLFINGTEPAKVSTAPGGVYANTAATLNIGGLGRLPASFRYEGALAHVAIFPTALATTDIDAVMLSANVEGWY